MHDAQVKESGLGLVSGHRVENTTAGKRIIPSTPRRGSSVSISLFKLKSVEDDYLVCREWDGSSEGTTDVYIAKHPELRCSLAEEEVYGVTHEYSYALDGEDPDDLNVIRTADDGSDTEDQRVVPPWKLDEFIYAIECDTLLTVTIEAASVQIEWLMMHTRHWAQIAE